MKARILLLPLLVLAACEPDTIGSAPDDSGGDGGVADGGGADGGGDGGGGGGDGGQTGPTEESDCQDGVDEDQDGVTDCEDSDCAAFWRCALPTSVAYHTLFDFRGNEIECEAWGIEFDVEIEDCRTDASGRLSLYEGPEACAECERTYRGPLTYAVDTCTELLGKAQPQDATFGFVFISETERELWVPDDTWTWYLAATLVPVAGVWTNTTSEDIWADPDDCDNGDQNLGNLTVTVDFSDL